MLLVERVEALVELAEAVRAHLPGRQAHGDLVALAVIAHVGHVADAAQLLGDALVLEPLLGPLAELLEDARHVLRLGVVEHADVRAGELVAEVGHDVAECAEQARRRGHDHRERAHDPRDGVRVHRPRPAIGNERKLARVVASLDGDDAQRTGHVLVDDGEDALGSVFDRRQAHRVGNRLHRRPRGLRVELHLAAEQPRREVADDDVRVGDGRLDAALSVRGGTRLCAGRLRADAQGLRQLRHVGDRPAAGAHGVDVDGGHAQAEVADRRLAPDRRSPTEAERHIG